MALYNFKRIQPVPAANDFLDIVLSRTQRKTPTVIHKNYKIGRIRQFYMRKVKFTQDTFEEKLKAMLEEFPKLDDIHPFYADLMNVLYDKDHYKLALGQINTARHLIDQVAKEYVRLLKFGDSLYRCKQLKKAALGRMATIMKRQKDSLAYLEQVRQHLSRLPSIDPNTRTLLVCGYPNVGKSSFMNKVTRADVDVQPYAFTTKSLFVGHMDYKYLRWQVIDTPGILDHPLEQMNTIEMQSVTALAHLRACILFFMDLSEHCGYSVEDQIKLYHNIKPLFTNKPTFIIINKIDIVRPEDLPVEQQDMLKEIAEKDGAQIIQLSCFTDEGVMDARNTACEKLLTARVEVKLKGQKINDVINKLHLAEPQARDNVARPPIIPEEVKGRSLFNLNDPNRRKLERDLEAENGGPGVYSVDLNKLYIFKDPEWRYDSIPEIIDGRNVADFIDPDIQEKLDLLEREEERLETEGFYDSTEEIVDSEDEALRDLATEIREKKKFIIQAHRSKKMMKNRPILPRTVKTKSNKFFNLSLWRKWKKQLGKLGLDTSAVRARSLTRKRKRNDNDGDDSEQMDIDLPPNVLKSRRLGVSVSRDRSVAGLAVGQQKQTTKYRKFAQRRPNQFAKAGEADRSIQVKRPKHLFSKKSGIGKRDWR
ncbi:5133_t:CDS:10 [Ambispora gerdemannii]|uniref:Nucleolar GTP-binding protein 1 n=1 Tax=Ambispora gerdemannii TaxID=144530 RepID=A0A9N8WC57_9GLOM|nr:5133_t:CDS:10 [Ambispora gerdemannii]